MASWWLAAVLVGPVAQAWPVEAAWVAVEQAGVALTDDPSDAGGGTDEIVSTGLRPAVRWSADLDALYVGFHLGDELPPGPMPASASWGMLWQVSPATEPAWLITVDQPSWSITLHEVEGATLDALTFAEPIVLADLAAGAVRARTLADGTYWLEAAIPLSGLRSHAGVRDDSSVQWAFLTWAGAISEPWSDVAGCTGPVPACTTVSSVLSDPVILDEDADGSPLPLERMRLSDPLDPDSDDDGVRDGDDPGPLTCDTDGDGLLDGLELGIRTPTDGTDAAGCFVPAHPQGRRTDPADADSDDGGLVDGLEDRDHDGLLSAWETDPSDPSDDLDSDRDTLPDVIEAVRDWDGDGVPERDLHDPESDQDGDGVPNLLDDDADQDGLADLFEGVSDQDEDGLPAFLDDDSDGDGIADGADGLSDLDVDGLPAYLDLDADGDGLGDAVEGLGDFDEDGRLDYLDRDADGDGRLDINEGLADLDCDGVVDYLDPGADDGICETGLPRGAIDTDAFDGTTDELEPAPKVTYTGGACDSGVVGSLGWLVLVAALLGIRRRGAVGLAVAATLGVITAPAEAGQYNVQRFRPTVDGWRFVQLEDGQLAVGSQFGAGVLVDHVSSPLQIRTEEGAVDLVGALTTAHVLGHATPSRYFRFGMVVPVHFGIEGLGRTTPAVLGDLRLGLKSEVWASERGLPAHLAVFGELELPTGAGWAGVGARTAVLQLGAAARLDPVPWLSVGAELGARTGTGEELGDLILGPEIAYGLGLSVRPNDRIWISGELDGAWSVRNGTQPGASPLEGLGVVRGHLGRDVLLTAGGGGGLTAGVGAPAWRVLVGVSWLPGFIGRAEPVAVDEAVEPPPTQVANTPGTLILRVVGPHTEAMRGALVAVQNSDVHGETDREGIFQRELAPGEYFVGVSFGGRTPEYRAFTLPPGGTVDLTIVLFDEARPLPDAPSLPEP